MNPESHVLRLPSGAAVNVLKWRSATPTEPTALLVHGLGDTAWVWHGIAPTLCQQRDVVAVDLRGHGASDRGSRDDYRVPQMALDVLAVASALGLRRPWLMGHSLGAAVAIHAAAQSIERFCSLALVDYANEVAPSGIRLVRAVLAAMQGTYAEVSALAAILKRRHVLACPDLLDRIAAAALQATEGGYRLRFDPAVIDALADAEGPLVSADCLAQLHIPTLVVRGALSGVVPAEGAQRLTQQCPSAQLAVVPMAGHSVQVDNPRGLLRALGVEPLGARLAS